MFVDKICASNVWLGTTIVGTTGVGDGMSLGSATNFGLDWSQILVWDWYPRGHKFWFGTLVIIWFSQILTFHFSR